MTTLVCVLAGPQVSLPLPLRVPDGARFGIVLVDGDHELALPRVDSHNVEVAELPPTLPSQLVDREPTALRGDAHLRRRTLGNCALKHRAHAVGREGEVEPVSLS